MGEQERLLNETIVARPMGARQSDGEIRTFERLWLEVSNVRLNTSVVGVIDVQLKGDKDSRWWAAPNLTAEFKVFLEAMEKKRPIHACLGITGAKFVILDVSIMFVEPPR